ncbi:hypothetical protein O3M35_006512 [Rhynocoris fuscipes]|uniref:DUF4485 domain-containing protein n=1 Tax=Rhynocoris fuscipes TaxID=488301 RepID=A0AAW1DGB8_9HEMI
MSVKSDCVFVDLVDQISALYECLPSPEDKKNVQYWINHLSGELDKIKRNEYAQNLFDLIVNGFLKYPFNQPPPAGRLPDYCDIVNPRLNPFAIPKNEAVFRRDSEDSRILSRFKPPNCFIRQPGKRIFKEMREKCKQAKSTCSPCPPLCEPINNCKEVTRLRICPTSTVTVGCPEDIKNREEVEKLIDAICPATLLDEFAAQVARFTCDKGQEMFRFISKETNYFRKIVQSVFESLNKDMIKALDEEQARVKDNYEAWERFVLTKTKNEMDVILDIIPDFNWDEMKNNRSYLWFKIYPPFRK